MIPVFGNDWKVWARQLTTALNSMPLILRAKTADASAAEDGALLWNRSPAQVEVARNGAFVKMTTQVAVPASATSAGQAGDWAYDNGFIYVCTATNTWRRAVIAAW
jgi:hypothetical protein